MRHRKSILFVLFIAFTFVALGQPATPDHKILFEKAKFTMETKGDLKGAITLFGDLIKKYPKEREYAAKSQLLIGECYEKLGAKEAQKAYENVLANYADQPELTKVARERLNVITGAVGTTKANTEVAMRRIWEAGYDRPIGISPDGKYAIFISLEDKNIYLRNLQTGEQKRVTKDATIVTWTGPTGLASISPNGKLIAYGWTNGSITELRLSALDGSNMKILHNGVGRRSIYSVAWMPDNFSILAVTYDINDKTYRRHVISLSDGAIKDIGQPDQFYKSWSCPTADGKHVVYIQRGDIYIWDARTEKDSVLIHNPDYNAALGWTPDGSRLIFTRYRSNTNDLYTIRIKNGQLLGEPELLRSDIGTKTLYLTKDGRLFRFENTGAARSYIVPVDQKTGKMSGIPALVDANYPDAYSAAWSEDGKQLYYNIWKGSSENRKLVLVIRSDETGQTRELKADSKLPYYFSPVLSPDGSRFMVVGGTPQSKDYGLFTIDSKSGDVSQLAKIPTTNVSVDPAQNWSPDGSAIYYKLRSVETSNLYLIRRKDLANGEEKDYVPEIGFHTMKMKISSDGNRLVYSRVDKPNKSVLIAILDLQTKKEVVLKSIPDGPYSSWILFPSWSPDGKNVLVSIATTLKSELWRLPAAGGEGEKLDTFNGYCPFFVLHPDGKRMVYSQTITNNELWVLENFLPK